MLFNGKYYNKPGHLGMTTKELKNRLNSITNDFALAPVTFMITGSGSVATAVAITRDAMGGLSSGSIDVNSPSEPQAVNVILYKGSAVAAALSAFVSVTITGDITETEEPGVYIITGPGTITYHMSA